MRWLTLAAVLASLATLPAEAATPPTCKASQLDARVRQTSGAAGTMGPSLAFRNTSESACSLAG